MQRPEGQENDKIKTGQIEVLVNSLEVLNVADAMLPISPRKFNQAKEALQMQYRYISLRYAEIQRNLRLKSQLTMRMREFLINCGFVDVDTPTLFRKTPGVSKFFFFISMNTSLKGKVDCHIIKSPINNKNRFQ